MKNTSLAISTDIDLTSSIAKKARNRYSTIIRLPSFEEQSRQWSIHARNEFRNRTVGHGANSSGENRKFLVCSLSNGYFVVSSLNNYVFMGDFHLTFCIKHSSFSKQGYTLKKNRKIFSSIYSFI